MCEPKSPRKVVWQKNIGLYRDDGLAIVKNKSACLADKTRRELQKSFRTIQHKNCRGVNANFLDVTFKLSN